MDSPHLNSGIEAEIATNAKLDSFAGPQAMFGFVHHLGEVAASIGESMDAGLAIQRPAARPLSRDSRPGVSAGEPVGQHGAVAMGSSGP